MTVLLASFLCGSLVALRPTIFGFLPLLMLAAALAFIHQGAVAGIAALVALQAGYLCGALLSAALPARTAPPALCRAIRRRA